MMKECEVCRNLEGRIIRKRSDEGVLFLRNAGVERKYGPPYGRGKLFLNRTKVAFYGKKVTKIILLSDIKRVGLDRKVQMKMQLKERNE